METLPRTATDTTLTNSFLGQTVQIVMITGDLHKAMGAMVRLGVGPWSVYTLGPHNVTKACFRGQPMDAVIRVALAFVGTVMWELIQPISGACAQREFLERHGDGIHHVSADCAGMGWEERIAQFEARGFRMVQAGTWLDRVPFAYFEAEDAPGLCVESIYIPDDFEMPAPEERFPPDLRSDGRF
jgi:Glyoxalase/Bleomycin resistance protein/Dioxygenase superfamily